MRSSERATFGRRAAPSMFEITRRPTRGAHSSTNIKSTLSSSSTSSRPGLVRWSSAAGVRQMIRFLLMFRWADDAMRWNVGTKWLERSPTFGRRGGIDVRDLASPRHEGAHSSTNSKSTTGGRLVRRVGRRQLNQSVVLRTVAYAEKLYQATIQALAETIVSIGKTREDVSIGAPRAQKEYRQRPVKSTLSSSTPGGRREIIG